MTSILGSNTRLQISTAIVAVITLLPYKIFAASDLPKKGFRQPNGDVVLFTQKNAVWFCRREVCRFASSRELNNLQTAFPLPESEGLLSIDESQKSYSIRCENGTRTNLEAISDNEVNNYVNKFKSGTLTLESNPIYKTIGIYKLPKNEGYIYIDQPFGGGSPRFFVGKKGAMRSVSFTIETFGFMGRERFQTDYGKVLGFIGKGKSLTFEEGGANWDGNFVEQITEDSIDLNSLGISGVPYKGTYQTPCDDKSYENQKESKSPTSTSR